MRIGRYVLGEEVARGGLAAVHLGAMRADGGFVRVVAVKRLHAQYARDPDFVAMLQDEARLSARVRDPHVVPTLEVLQDGDELLVVMEYVIGATMAELIVAARRRDTLVPPSVAAAWVRDALLGLHAAHVASDAAGQPMGIVHRDVSPQNVIVGEDGMARVLDFGVAKARARNYRTEDGTVRGKLGYMAPEQLYGEAVDARTDVFGAGVLLWETLCGERLFVGPDGEPALAAVLERVVEPPSQRSSDVPRAFDDIIARALAQRPGDRFPSALAMATALEQAVSIASPGELTRWLERSAGALLASRRSDVAQMERSTDASDETDATAAMPAPSAGPRTSPIAAAVLAVAIAAGAGWWLRGEPLRPARAAWPVLQRIDLPPAPLSSTPSTAVSSAPPSAPPSAPSALASPSATTSPATPRPVGRVPAPHRPAPVAQPGPPPGFCNPPYFIDERGHKRYKRSCLR